MATAPATTGDKRFPGSSHTIVGWAIDVLSGLGLPATPTNIGVMVTWANAESGGYSPNVSGGRNNPLNTTQRGPGWVGQGGSQGNISDFGTYEDGVRAQVTNLKNPRFGYPGILAGLQAQNPAATFQAINASGFGTHFPGGYTGGGPVQPGSTTGSNINYGAGGGTQAATTTAFGLPDWLPLGPVNPLNPLGGLSGIIGNIPGIGDLYKNLNPFQQIQTTVEHGILDKLIFLGEMIAGMVFITLGVVIVLVDTGALSKAPVPIPIPV